jgi:hypothetical protein
MIQHGTDTPSMTLTSAPTQVEISRSRSKSIQETRPAPSARLFRKVAFLPAVQLTAWSEVLGLAFVTAPGVTDMIPAYSEN